MFQTTNQKISNLPQKTHRLHQLRRSPTYLSFGAHTKGGQGQGGQAAWYAKGYTAISALMPKTPPLRSSNLDVFPGCGSIFFCENLTFFHHVSHEKMVVNYRCSAWGFNETQGFFVFWLTWLSSLLFYSRHWWIYDWHVDWSLDSARKCKKKRSFNNYSVTSFC